MFNVSVIIPAYNAGEWIRRSIQSVLNQTYKPYEIIVVDDGSTDNTYDVVAKYGDAVRYVYQDNAGVASARNKGIEESTGNWIAFLDADDEWMPYRLESQIDLLKKHPKILWASGSTEQRVYKNGKITVRRFSCGDIKNDIIVMLQNFSPVECIHTNTILVARSLIDKVGLMNVNMKVGEDLEFWIRISKYAPYLVYVHKTISIYHWFANPSSLTAGILEKNQKTREKKSVPISGVIVVLAKTVSSWEEPYKSMLVSWLAERLLGHLKMCAAYGQPKELEDSIAFYKELTGTRVPFIYTIMQYMPQLLVQALAFIYAAVKR